jgi:hypothetical protein
MNQENKHHAEARRLAFLLGIVHREGEHLLYSHHKLLARQPDLNWARSLADAPDEAEVVDAFVSRFSRMQDTLGDKLIPVLLRLVLEPLGSALDNLNRAEKLGWVSSADAWLDARSQRNKLVHEYMDEPDVFLDALRTALEHVPLLIETYNRINRYAHEHLPETMGGMLIPGEPK